MADRILGILALATLVAFLGVLIAFVPRADLIGVVLASLVLVVRDVWLTLRGSGG